MSVEKPDNVVCEGGPRDGYWYSGKFWLTSVAAEEHLMATRADAGEPLSPSTYLGYRVTEKIRGNPVQPNVYGNVAVWDPR